MADATHCYIGIWAGCRCIRFVTVDSPDYRTENAKEVARLIRHGYEVQHVLIADFKAGKHGTFGCADKARCPNPHAKKANRK